MKPHDEAMAPFYARERVLIVEVNWLGDVLFSTPALRAIRKAHPGAYIAALVVPRCKDVLLGNNYLDEVIVLDEPGRHRGFLGKLKLVRDLRLRRFNIVYFFHRSFSRTLCCLLAGIQKRIGYYTKKRGFLLTDKIHYPEGPCHRADIYYYVIAKDKIPRQERYCDFFISGEDKSYVDKFLQNKGIREGRGFVVLHVGGNWDLKLWPAVYFAELIGRIREESEVDIIISGTLTDLPRAQEVAALSKYEPVIACGMTNIKQLGALFQKSDFVVSADSGPLHVAVAVKAKVAALFGPTSFEQTGPLTISDDCLILFHKDTHCVIPCYNLKCQDNVCMKALTPDFVFNEVKKQGWLLHRK